MEFRDDISGNMDKSAHISKDGLYRYALMRIWPWDSGNGPMTFVMLNPSTADAEVDDQTIRRCTGFARRENATGFNVTNLFAFRATNPADLNRAQDSVGQDWAMHVYYDLQFCAWFKGTLVFAWGAYDHPLLSAQITRITETAADFGLQPMCLGCTKSGAPRHPSRLAINTELEPWP